MKIRTITREKMVINMLFVVLLTLCPIVYADDGPPEDGILEIHVSLSPKTCHEKCGCEEMYFYDAATDRCLINFTRVFKKVVTNYENLDSNNLPDDEMAKQLYIESQKIFQGIMVSVFLFIVCAAVCVISACIYCCRINYTDRSLKSNVKKLAKKLNTDYKTKKPLVKPPLAPASQTCNVIVEDAGVFVV
ncbi:uncharacterized protein LOC118271155 isoform X1 [Spodoptera frugiperda]|uniref:Uncharacterized protein LOC118271155 isoform X1 n=2 Tax=Spodoptera frugiperda TaxID=7108 RepID=A0A9R0ELM6_SPOFR|nr:uncharacterized protein LOC118271155 isoform X1 [Spodoptera frugiperda]